MLETLLAPSGLLGALVGAVCLSLVSLPLPFSLLIPGQLCNVAAIAVCVSMSLQLAQLPETLSGRFFDGLLGSLDINFQPLPFFCLSVLIA